MKRERQRRTNNPTTEHHRTQYVDRYAPQVPRELDRARGGRVEPARDQEERRQRHGRRPLPVPAPTPRLPLRLRLLCLLLRPHAGEPGVNAHVGGEVGGAAAVVLADVVLVLERLPVLGRAVGRGAVAVG